MTAAPRQPRLAALAGWAGFAALAAFLPPLLNGGLFFFPLDDAFITIHNATVLLAGVDPNFGDLSPLHGATSPVHLLLVAGAAAALGPLAGAWAAMTAATVAYAAGLDRLARDAGMATAPRLLFVAVGLGAGWMLLNLLNGLETGLAAAGLTWAIALRRADRPRALGALAGLLPFVRPELALFAGALLLEHALARRGDRASREAIALAAAVAAPFALWLLLATGAPWPRTAAVKLAFFAEHHAPFAARLEATMGRGVGRFLLQLGPAALGPLFLPRGRLAAALLLPVAAVVAIALETMPTALSTNHGRYLYALLPALVAGFALGWREASRRRRAWAATLMAAGLAWATLSERVAFAIYADETRSYARDHVAILDWLDRAMPPGAALAVHDIGLPAFRLDRKLVDLVGLRGPDAAAIHRAVTAREGPDSRGRALAAILARSGATHVLLLDGWDEFETFGRSLREAGVALDPVRVEGRYRAYAVRAAPR